MASAELSSLAGTGAGNWSLDSTFGDEIDIRSIDDTNDGTGDGEVCRATMDEFKSMVWNELLMLLANWNDGQLVSKDGTEVVADLTLDAAGRFTFVISKCSSSISCSDEGIRAGPSHAANTDGLSPYPIELAGDSESPLLSAIVDWDKMDGILLSDS